MMHGKERGERKERKGHLCIWGSHIWEQTWPRVGPKDHFPSCVFLLCALQRCPSCLCVYQKRQGEIKSWRCRIKIKIPLAKKKPVFVTLRSADRRLHSAGFIAYKTGGPLWFCGGISLSQKIQALLHCIMMAFLLFLLHIHARWCTYIRTFPQKREERKKNPSPMAFISAPYIREIPPHPFRWKKKRGGNVWLPPEEERERRKACYLSFLFFKKEIEQKGGNFFVWKISFFSHSNVPSGAPPFSFFRERRTPHSPPQKKLRKSSPKPTFSRCEIRRNWAGRETDRPAFFALRTRQSISRKGRRGGKRKKRSKVPCQVGFSTRTRETRHRSEFAEKRLWRRGMHTLDQSHQMSKMFHRSFVVVCKEACFSLSLSFFCCELAKVKAVKKFIFSRIPSKKIRQSLYFFKNSHF